MAADAEHPDLTGADATVRFTELYDRHGPRLLRYLRAQVAPAEAEDLLGETFCQAWDQRERYDPARASASQWLFGIAVNLLRRHRRAWVRGQRAVTRLAGSQHAMAPGTTESHEGRVVEELAARATTDQLTTALAELNEYDLEVLMLTSSGQLSVAEIADTLDIPPGTVRSRLHRARQQLRRQAPLTSLLTAHGDI